MENNELILELDQKPTLKTRIKSCLYFLVRIIIAAAIITWLVKEHYKAFLNVVLNIQVSWLVVAIILNLFVYLGSAYRWLLLLKVQKIKVSFWEAFSLTMQGAFFSLVIPGGSIGGDIIKTGFLFTRIPKGSKLVATSTVFMDRFLGMFGQFSIGIISALFGLSLINRMSNVAIFTYVLILFASILGILVGFLILYHRKLERFNLYRWCIKIGDKYSKGYIHHIIEILDIYNNSAKVLLESVLVGAICIQINMSFILIAIAKGIHATHLALNPFILAMSFGNTAGLLPITPSGVGTRDAVIKSILTASGVLESNAVSIPLLFTALLLFFSILGGLFFVFSHFSKKKE